MFRLLSLFLPIIFPSWRFFRAVEPSPRIQIRQQDTWVDSHPRPQRIALARQVRRMFWNPDWNRYLYAVSLSERLIIDPSAHSRAGIDALLKAQTGADTLPPWRIMFVTQEAGEIVGTVEYDSTDPPP